MNEFMIPNPVGVSRLSQWFGLWAIDENYFAQMVDWAQTHDWARHFAENAGRNLLADLEEGEARSEEQWVKVRGGYGYEMRPNGVAVLSMSGPMSKYVSSMGDGTSTVALNRTIRVAAANQDVKAIVLRMDSPGGTVAGTKDLADAVAMVAGTRKPVYTFIEDMGASAAYWVGSQATKVYANDMAMVGSIGTYGVLYDQSAAAGMMGIRPIVVRAGEFKGAGVPGTPITEKQVEEYQRKVDEMNAFFLEAVSRGRKMDMARVSTLADGRAHIGEKAAALGLIDGIANLDAVVEAAGRGGRVTMRRAFGASAQAEDDTVPPLADVCIDAGDDPVSQTKEAGEMADKGATLKELKSACVGADDAFLVRQLEAEASVQEAMQAWMVEQGKRLEAKETALAEAKAAKPAEPATVRPGVAPLKTHAAKSADDDEGGDPIEAFDAKVRAVMQTNGGNRQLATAQVKKRNPEMFRAFLLATNGGKAAAAINGKFED